MWAWCQARKCALATGAGVKHLRLIERGGLRFQFEMNMGRPGYTREDLHLELPFPAASATLWRSGWAIRSASFSWTISIGIGAPWAPKSKPIRTFPNRTNVSFVKRVDAHTIDVRFFERGVGRDNEFRDRVTGAAAAAILRGIGRKSGARAHAGRSARFALGGRDFPDGARGDYCRWRILCGSCRRCRVQIDLKTAKHSWRRRSDPGPRGPGSWAWAMWACRSAVEFAKAGFPVTGIDIGESKVARVNAGDSYVCDVPAATLGPLV